MPWTEIGVQHILYLSLQLCIGALKYDCLAAFVELGSVCVVETDWVRATVNTPFGFHEPGFESRLPKPYNKGNGWYPAAMAAIKTDVARFDTVDEWRIFWYRFPVVQRNPKDFEAIYKEACLEDMFDGLRLLGL